MKHRQPEVKFAADQDKNLGFDEVPAHRYRVTLLTPLYGGGVATHTPDPQRPVRATEVLYGLRFWWRLQRLRALRKRYPEDRLEMVYKSLFKEERKLWGAPATKDRAWPCQVRVRIGMENEDCDTAPCLKYINPFRSRPDNDGKVWWKWQTRWLFPQYALFPAGQNTNPDKLPADPGGRTPSAPTWNDNPDNRPHEAILPGLQFDLIVGCNDPDNWQQVEDALIAWSNFGGVGARTRRGLGAVRVEMEIPEQDGQQRIFRLLPLISRDDALDRYGCEVICRQEKYSDADTAWQDGIAKLRQFTQEVGIARGENRISLWPEPHTIRRAVDHHKQGHTPDVPLDAFPRAAFGLPKVFEFPKGGAKSWHNRQRFDPAKTILNALNNNGLPARMASPLLLRPRAHPGESGGVEEGGYQAIAVLLPTDVLQDLRVQLDGGKFYRRSWTWKCPRKRTPVNGAWWAGEWIEQVKDAARIKVTPIQDFIRRHRDRQPYRNGDPSIPLPLAAFLDFFKQ